MDPFDLDLNLNFDVSLWLQLNVRGDPVCLK